MIILYGIKNCDAVKKARDWLEKNHIAYQFHDFRVDGVTETQVHSWINTLGLETLINKRSTTWKELDESIKKKFTASSAPAIVAANPTLIKRPLLEIGTQKYVGFKDTEYKTIFN